VFVIFFYDASIFNDFSRGFGMFDSPRSSSGGSGSGFPRLGIGGYTNARTRGYHPGRSW